MFVVDATDDDAALQVFVVVFVVVKTDFGGDAAHVEVPMQLPLLLLLLLLLLFADALWLMVDVAGVGCDVAEVALLMLLAARLIESAASPSRPSENLGLPATVVLRFADAVADDEDEVGAAVGPAFGVDVKEFGVLLLLLLFCGVDADAWWLAEARGLVVAAAAENAEIPAPPPAAATDGEARAALNELEVRSDEPVAGVSNDP